MKSSDEVLMRLDVPAERQLDAERKAALKEDVLQRIGGRIGPPMSESARFAGAS